MLLSEALPILENLGFQAIEQRPFLVRPRDAVPVWIHDFGLTHRDAAHLALDVIGPPLKEAAAPRLVPPDGGRWLQSTGGQSGTHLAASCAAACVRKIPAAGAIPFSETYMQHTLAANPQITRCIVALFEARFDPARDRQSPRVEEIRQSIQQGLETVTSLDEDRIISFFVRRGGSHLTHEFLPTNRARPTASTRGTETQQPAAQFPPRPLPMVEIFVYSPAVEGVHLRFGAVAQEDCAGQTAARIFARKCWAW